MKAGCSCLEDFLCRECEELVLVSTPEAIPDDTQTAEHH